MNDRQKLLIVAAIVIILLLLIGAYALSGSNNNTTATPTPTVIPTPTPTPTPVPQGGTGAGTGAGNVTPTATPVPTPIPTPVATPTPKPQLTYNSYWPSYDFHWTEHPTVTPAPISTPTPTPASSTVGFNDARAGFVYYRSEGIEYLVYNYWEDDERDAGFSGNDARLIVTIQLNRSGDLSSSYTVPVTIGNFATFTDHSEIEEVQYARFDAGDSTADMTLFIDTSFVYGGLDMMWFTIEPSSEYNIMEPYTWGEGWDGGSAILFQIRPAIPVQR